MHCYQGFPFTLGVVLVSKFIDGAWVPSVSGDLFEDRNPANTNDVVGVFQKSTAADAADAIDAARLAYDRWRLVPAPPNAKAHRLQPDKWRSSI